MSEGEEFVLVSFELETPPPAKPTAKSGVRRITYRAKCHACMAEVASGQLGVATYARWLTLAGVPICSRHRWSDK